MSPTDDDLFTLKQLKATPGKKSKHWSVTEKMVVVNIVLSSGRNIYEISQLCGLHWATVNSWVTRVQRDGPRGLNRKANARKGKTSLNAEQQACISENRKHFQRCEKGPERIEVIMAVRAEILQLGPEVSETTVRRRLSEVVLEDYDGDENPVRYTGQLLAQAELDHKKLKVILVSDLGDGTVRVIGRGWLTSMIEIAARVILGADVYLHHPNTTAVARVLTHAAYPKSDFPLWPYGKTELLRLDNARELNNDGLFMGAGVHSIQIEKRPTHTPTSGPYIESFYATLDHLLKNLPGGYVRLSTGKVKKAKSPTLTIKQLNELVLKAVDLYHRAPHSGLDSLTPLEAWEIGLIGGDTVAGLQKIHPPSVSKEQ